MVVVVVVKEEAAATCDTAATCQSVLLHVERESTNISKIVQLEYDHYT